MAWVTVGDAGNTPDTRYATPGYGGVSYTYNIGMYEVTNSQYAEFLNAVAGADPNGLYSDDMGTYAGITRSGSSGSYTYSVVAGWGNRPANYISWYDTLRFANWMHNGQPTGDQDISTTEDGAYDMSLGSRVVRKPDALVWLPSEDEWYKAAYYKGGSTSAGYWDYATQSDMPPYSEAPPGTDMVNGSANTGGAVGDLCNVGAYTAKPSDSAYGTFDQGGNAWEWNEADIYGDGTYRGLRGGYFGSAEMPLPPWGHLRASFRGNGDPATGQYSYGTGFRIAGVPEPTTLAFSILAGPLILCSRRRI